VGREGLRELSLKENKKTRIRKRRLRSFKGQKKIGKEEGEKNVSEKKKGSFVIVVGADAKHIKGERRKETGIKKQGTTSSSEEGKKDWPGGSKWSSSKRDKKLIARRVFYWK